MLTYPEFLLLPLNKKARYLWEHGVFITCRMGNGHMNSLYALSNFFAELYYDPEQNRIIGIEAFTGYERLEEYAALVSLNDLIK